MLDDATDRYSRIAGEAPGSEHAAEGLFRAGLMRFKQERPGQAAEMWSRYLDLAADAESKARAEYWLSRVYKALGEDGQGTQALEAAVSASPLDYYGLRSAAALKQSPSPPAEARAPGAETDWAAIQAWLVETAGPPPSSGANAIEQSAGWQRAVELFAAGLTKESSREFRALTEDHRPAWDYYK